MSPKDNLRKKLLKLRHSITSEKRKEVQQSITNELYPQLQNFSKILSFASKKEEINLWPLNAILANEGRLHFPRLISDTQLRPFVVKHIAEELIMHPKWHILEPDPNQCSPISIDLIDCVLVPGLGFDMYNQRIGYGKGYYDNFLVKLHCPFYGIGFKEQYLINPIPSKSHDIPLTKIYLF